ncbi:4-hydroxybenzoate transporter (plasmid) [Roseomonas mucosa]|uniref:3-(3-hydroxy-phenyl)propionate transporter MhpT n=1 Tax=Roseomonas mucosa TaxID=207340 RepID=UPI002207055C|nr:4-hydroxybenzoate transporter [Roseomonas mucosa]
MSTTTIHVGVGTRVLALVFLAAMIEGFDLQAAGVAAPKLAPAFGLHPSQMGVFFSSATIGAIFGALAGGIIGDRYGRRAGLVLSLAVFGAFSLGTAWAGTFDHLVIMRFLTGVGMGGALPNLISIAAEAASPERRGRAVAIMYAGVPLGGAIASLVSMVGLHEDWQSIFFIGGLMPLVLVIPLYLILPSFRVVHNAAAPASHWRALFARGSMGNTMLLWAAFFFGMIVLYLLLNWLPQLLVSLGFAREQAAMVQILFNIGGSAGCMLGGQLLDSSRPALATVAWFTVLIVAVVLFSVVPGGNMTAAVAAGILTGATLMGSQALLYGIAPQCYLAEVRGTGVGLAVSVGRIGSITGPLLAGFLLASGMGPQQLLFAILPFVTVCGLATVALIIRRGRRPALLA